MNENEYVLEVPGVPVELQSSVEQGIRNLTDAVRRVADKLDAPFRLQRIHVTDHFQQFINDTFRELSDSPEYVARREEVLAIGKTFPSRLDGRNLGFTIVIDAKHTNELNLQNPHCLKIILHELSHIILESEHLERLGEEEYLAGCDDKERLLKGWAKTLLDEFAVDRLVDVFVRKMVTRSDSEPCSLRSLDENQGLDWISTMLNGFTRMPEVVDERTREFRCREIDFEEFCRSVFPRIKDFLVVLSHTAARYMETHEWEDIHQRIRQTEASRRFLGEYLDVMLEQFDSYTLDEMDTCIRIVADAIERVFERCGIGLNDVPEGLYISVNEPVP